MGRGIKFFLFLLVFIPIFTIVAIVAVCLVFRFYAAHPQANPSFDTIENFPTTHFYEVGLWVKFIAGLIGVIVFGIVALVQRLMGKPMLGFKNDREGDTSEYLAKSETRTNAEKAAKSKNPFISE